ncbi:MAG: hypothetical protein JWO85_3254, partial [Candidatus Eremiobacteraeota bacterium]|nr:hypothetical protein [Candidatus Eremiobacteraeota bacterium]
MPPLQGHEGPRKYRNVCTILTEVVPDHYAGSSMAATTDTLIEEYRHGFHD